MRALLAVLLLAAACGGKAKPAAAPPPAAIENKIAEPAPVEPAPAAVAPASPEPGGLDSLDELERRLETGVTSVPECDDYLRAFVELARCDKAEPAMGGLREAIAATLQAWEAWKDLQGEALAAAQRAAGPGCKAGHDALRQTAVALGCPP